MPSFAWSTNTLHSKMSHQDGLAPLRDFGRSGDCWYCVRDYIHGRTLQSRLAEAALDVVETLAVGRCLLSAIQNLHSRGELHGNIKPSNLIVNIEGAIDTATLVDGGLRDGGQFDQSLDRGMQPL